MSMIEGFSVFGTNISDILNQWAYFGVFDYILPFLLIFAIIYAILSKIPTFSDNSGAVLIISITIGLLSLQFDYVPLFFSRLFPHAGIAIGVLIIVLILTSFMGTEATGVLSQIKYIMFGVGIIAAIFVVFTSFSFYGWYSNGFWLSQYSSDIFALIVILAVIGLVVVLGKKKSS